MTRLPFRDTKPHSRKGTGDAYHSKNPSMSVTAIFRQLCKESAAKQVATSLDWWSQRV
jgi:hypothetical protein